MSARAAQAFLLGVADIGLKRRFSGPVFNEFVIDCRRCPGLYEALRKRGYLLGIPLARWFPEFKDHYLCALTEIHYLDVSDLVKEVKTCAHDS
jgi:hypothetical protein